MDDFLSDLLGEEWDKDDPMSEVHDFGSFLTMFANQLDEDSTGYHEVKNLDKQYNARNSSNNPQAYVNAERHQKAQNHLQDANKYYQAKKWGFAVDHLSQVIKSDYQDSNIYLMRGHCYHNLGENKLALKDIDRAFDLDPKNANVILIRTALKIRENFEEAIDDLLRYFQLTGENAASEIVDLFAKFLSLEDEHWYTVISKLSQFLKSDTAKHVPIVVKIINRVGGEHLFVRLCNLNEVNSDTVTIFALLFRALLNTDFDKTLDILSESIKNNPDSSTHYYIRSQAYEHKLNWDAALEDINKAIELDPDDYNYYKMRADFTLKKSKLTYVIKDYEKYLSLGGNNVEDRLEIEHKISEIKKSFYPDEELLKEPKDQIADGNIELAKSYHDKGMTIVSRDIKGGINLYQKAINAAPGYAPAYVRMFEVCYQLGDWDRALTYINDAIRIDPNDANSFNNRAGIYYSLKKFDDALKDFETTLKLDPNNIQTLVNLLAVYLKQKKWDKALEILNQCINLDASDPKFYYYRGVVYENKNMPQKSINEFEKYCELGGDPQRESLEAVRERIENLKKDL